jgi:hypothetical protein
MFYEKVCLNEQPFIKDQSITVAQHSCEGPETRASIAVRRFTRFKVGGDAASAIAHWDRGPHGGDEAGVAVKKPKGPKMGSGFAAANLDEETE